MKCRPGCAGCCIVISISSAIPGMPGGKPAGIRCVQLDANNLCRLFGTSSRPAICSAFTAVSYICGDSNREAFHFLSELEELPEIMIPLE